MIVLTSSIRVFCNLESSHLFPMKIELCEIYRTSSLKFHLYFLPLPFHFGLNNMGSY